MGSRTERATELDGIADWFAERGWRLSFSGFGFVWCGLAHLPDGDVMAPRYGGGGSRLGAARSAKKRYQVEQEGISPTL